MKLNDYNIENFILSFSSWTSDRKPNNTGQEHQPEIGSASSLNSPLYLIAVHQQKEHDNPARQSNHSKSTIYDNVEVRNYIVEIDGIRYPKGPIDINYTESNI